MKKKLWFVILAVLAALVITGGVVAATSGDIRIPFIGGNVEMQVQSPFQVSGTTTTDTTLKIIEGKTVSLYPGQGIAKGQLTIANVSPVDLAIGFDAVPRVITARDWPAFDTTLIVGGVKYRSGEYILPPGAKITAAVTV